MVWHFLDEKKVFFNWIYSFVLQRGEGKNDKYIPPLDVTSTSWLDCFKVTPLQTWTFWCLKHKQNSNRNDTMITSTKAFIYLTISVVEGSWRDCGLNCDKTLLFNFHFRHSFWKIPDFSQKLNDSEASSCIVQQLTWMLIKSTRIRHILRTPQ